MRIIKKILIVIVTLALAAGFYLTIDHFFLDYESPPSVPKKEYKVSPKPEKPVVKKEEKPIDYPDSPRKTFCEEFVSKAAPDILLKGPKAILERNKDEERCKVLLPTLSKLTQEQLDKVRQDIMRTCMEEDNPKKIEVIKERLKEVPTDCGE